MPAEPAQPHDAEQTRGVGRTRAQPTTASPEPNSDINAEQAVLGLALRSTDHLAAARAHLNGGREFYRPAHEALWQILCREADAGRPTDPISISPLTFADPVISRTLRNHPTFLADVVSTGTDATPSPEHYARRIAELAAKRSWGTLASRIKAAVDNPTVDVDTLIQIGNDWLDTQINDIRQRTTIGARARNIDEFLAGRGPETYNWCIPGLLEYTDRVIMTGEEGAGKSHLGRQIAVQAAAGLHPFTLDRESPRRVLIVDLENGDSLVAREIHPLRVKAGKLIDPDRLRVACRPEGIDLAETPADREWLAQLVTDANPDLLVIGPLYKMADGDPNEEKSAKPVSMFLDELRMTNQCALYIEAHVGNETGGKTKRARRPFGWSGWRRWPEFGLHIDNDGGLSPWRGARDRTRDWPNYLQRGGEWPFMSSRDEYSSRWVSIRECLFDANENLSGREISRRTGINEATVRRTLVRFKAEYEILRDRLDRVEGQDPLGL